MRIVVFGSIGTSSPVEPFARQDQFEPVCLEFGRVLGSGHTLVVESDSARTADASVVDGVRQRDPASRCRVEAWHRTSPKRGSRPKSEPFARDPWVVKVPIPVAYVGPAHMRMLRKADLAVVIGGGNNAYLAGQAARALDVRLVPVAAFGGAGRLLWQEIHDEVGPRNARSMDPGRFLKLGTVSSVVPAIRDEIASFPRIMIVHGRSKDKDTVADILRGSGATPIIMQDRYWAGETIPAEFERLALQVDGAVVVVTPDDEGRAVADANGLEHGVLGFRARQNVVLEYGWFWSRFGRENVALLVRGDVELPSDIAGVLYHHYTSPDELVATLSRFVGRFRDPGP